LLKKQCITCNESGHTYLECPHLGFGDMFLSFLGAPSISTGESAIQVRERVSREAIEVEEIKARDNSLKR